LSSPAILFGDFQSLAMQKKQIFPDLLTSNSISLSTFTSYGTPKENVKNCFQIQNNKT